MCETNNENIKHHKRFEYCNTRLKYRNGKNLTSVKVYTVAQESKYLLIFGVPKINLSNEVKREAQKYGPIKSIENMTNQLQNEGADLELFTDCFKVCFEKLENARRAKKILDAKNFYGGILHISYAPEYECLDELRQKLNQRRMEVNFRRRSNKTKRKRENESDEYSAKHICQ